MKSPVYVLLTWQGEEVQNEIDNVGSHYIEDIFDQDLPPGNGVWIWEGKILPDPNGHEPAWTDGSWRRLNDQELDYLSRYGDPWHNHTEEPASERKFMTTQSMFDDLIGDQS